MLNKSILNCGNVSNNTESGNPNYKGYFVDETALETAYPVGEAGWFANLVSTGTVWVWDTNNEEWTDSGVANTIESVTGNIVNNTDPSNPVVDQVQADWNQDDDAEVDFIKNKPTILNAISSSSTTNIDCSNGSSVILTQNSNINELTFTNVPSGSSYTLTITRVKDNSSTARTISFPVNITWANNQEPILTQLPNAQDIITLRTVDGGNSWYGVGNQSYVDAFVFTINTENLSAGSTNNDQFQLFTYDGGAGGSSYDFIVNWGDGNSDTITAFDDPACTHTYAVAGVYTISIIGKYWGFVINNGLKASGSVSGDKLKILNISQWGSGFKLGLGGSGVIGSFFYGAENLTITATDTLNVTGLRNFFRGFTNCTSLTTNMVQTILDSIITEDCEDLGQALEGTSLNPSVYSWNTSSIQFFDGFLKNNTTFNQDISNFSFESVVDGGMSDFCDGTELTTDNYNALLISLAKQTLIANQTVNFGDSKFIGVQAGDARSALLEAPYNWTIQDGGRAAEECSAIEVISEYEEFLEVNTAGNTIYFKVMNSIDTTDDTPTTLYTIELSEDSTYTVRGMVVAKRTGGTSGSSGDSAGYEFFATLKNIAGTASVVGSPSIVANEDQVGWNLTFTPSTSNINITVTGAVDNEIVWDLFLEIFTRS